jgi:hypothetical protein
VSEKLNFKLIGHLSHASSAPGALLSDALLPNLVSVQASGASTVSATCYERGPIAGVIARGGVITGGVERGKRPATAPVATKARAKAPVFAANAADAQLFGQQKTQLITMWALRGLDPWSEPT